MLIILFTIYFKGQNNLFPKELNFDLNVDLIPKILRNQLVVAKVMFESRPLLAHSLGTFLPFFGSFRKVAIPVSLQMEKMKGKLLCRGQFIIIASICCQQFCITHSPRCCSKCAILIVSDPLQKMPFHGKGRLGGFWLLEATSANGLRAS